MTKKRNASMAGCAALVLAGLTGAAALPAHAAPAGTHSSVTAVATAAAARVSTSVSPRSAVRGQAITFSGRAPGGATMVAQYLSGRTWKAVGNKAKASRGGSYSLTVNHVAASNIAYRVAAVVGKGTTYSNSATVTLSKPAKWYWLANYRPSASTLYRKATVSLGQSSQMYGITEYVRGDYASTWRLNGACSRLEAYAGSGIKDGDDPTKTRRQVQVMAGGKSLFSQWFGLGEGTDVDVSLTGANAVSVSVRHMGDSSQADYGIGNAKVLCTTAPGEYDPVD